MSVGLICEFNPFHSGHEYIIGKIRELTDEHVVCVMSGPFVQRAEPACADRMSRTVAALKGGADAVIELPVRFAVSSAENFVRGALSILKNVDDLSTLAFGVETDQIDALFEIANLRSDPATDLVIKQEMENGSSYPTAVSAALRKISSKGELYSQILTRPNNTLAIEYLKALKGTNIKPLPIRRAGGGYNDLIPKSGFASATAIREMLRQGRTREIADFISADMLKACNAPDYALYDSLLLFSMRKLTQKEIVNLPDVETGLEFSISKAVSEETTASGAIERIKSKRYTYSRLRRIFLYALLGINKQIMYDINSSNTRLLGIKEQSKELLKHFSPEIVTRNSSAPPDFFTDKSVSIDAYAEDIYSLLTKKEAALYHTTSLKIV